MDNKDPYRVECDKGGCPHCGHEKSWTVVDSQDVAIGQSFHSQEDADDLARYMNEAYWRGFEEA